MKLLARIEAFTALDPLHGCLEQLVRLLESKWSAIAAD